MYYLLSAAVMYVSAWLCLIVWYSVS